MLVRQCAGTAAVVCSSVMTWLRDAAQQAKTELLLLLLV
jgi:hypothetical protein